MRHLATLALAALVIPAPGFSAEPAPAAVDLREDARVDLIQTEVTVWPQRGGAEACDALGMDDFELQVDGKPRSIVAVDHLGVRLETPSSEDAAGQALDPPRGLSLVLFFDLWHLNFFVREFICPVTQPLAFEEARNAVLEQMRPGDRLLLVTFDGWPLVHYGWLTDPEEALAAIDRLETSRTVVAVGREHLHEQSWIDGMKDLLLALGREPGRKELIYLGDDFHFEDIALRLQEIVGRAQANAVVIHAVDLVASCRTSPGPGDGRMCPKVGGLGCSPFHVPAVLGPISWATGGELYRSESIAEAVAGVRERAACRYLISFAPLPQDGRRGPPRVRIDVLSKRLVVRAPETFEDPKRAPTERDRLDALAMLPRFGRGLYAEVGLWPLKPVAGTGKKQLWNALLVARIGREASAVWPEDPPRVIVDLAAFQGGRTCGEFRATIEGESLRALSRGERTELLVFPVEGVRPGSVTVALRANGEGTEIATTSRSESMLPEPPGPGEIRPWLLVDHLARVGPTLTFVPSLDGIISGDDPRIVLGYGCRGLEPEWRPPSGRLVAAKGERAVDLPFEWLEGSVDRPCGWLEGHIEPELAPGLWRFEPPASPDRGAEHAGFDFRIVADAN